MCLSNVQVYGVELHVTSSTWHAHRFFHSREIESTNSYRTCQSSLSVCCSNPLSVAWDCMYLHSFLIVWSSKKIVSLLVERSIPLCVIQAVHMHVFDRSWCLAWFENHPSQLKVAAALYQTCYGKFNLEEVHSQLKDLSCCQAALCATHT